MPDRTLALKYTRHDRHQSNYLLNSMFVSLKATEIKITKKQKCSVTINPSCLRFEWIPQLKSRTWPSFVIEREFQGYSWWISPTIIMEVQCSGLVRTGEVDGCHSMPQIRTYCLFPSFGIYKHLHLFIESV